MVRPRPAFLIPTVALRAIPDGVSERDAVLAEPATTVLGGPAPGRSTCTAARTLVIGAGTIGLIAAQVFRHAGPLVEYRGSTRYPGPAGRSASRRSRCGAHDDPSVASRYDVVLCAAGSPEAFALAIAAVANGGVVVLLGVPGERVDGVDVASILHKDATLHGVLNYSGAGPGTMSRALELIAQGVIDPQPIIDSTFPFERVGDAMQRADDRQRPRPKVLLDVASTESHVVDAP